MDDTVFVTLAYSVAGLLVALLCLSSWLRARSVHRQLQQHDGL